MRQGMRVVPAVLVLSGLAASGCRSTAAPVEGSEPPDSIWGYLAWKYDADGDGRVTAAEYTRDADVFARLDRDSDGAIVEADVALDGGLSPEMVREAVARIALRRLFEIDGDESRLHAGEVEEGVGLLDADFDGGTDLGELEAAAGRLDLSDPVFRAMAGMLGEATPLRTLVQVLDEDGDRRVAREEWFAYFLAHSDPDDELVWSETGTAVGELGSGASEESGVPPGELAPDFTLHPPDGGGAVRLASFREKKPVALIFGSYT